MALFNKQGKWFWNSPPSPSPYPLPNPTSPITPQKTHPTLQHHHHHQIHLSQGQGFPGVNGSGINLLVPEDMRLFNPEGSGEIWTVSGARGTQLSEDAPPKTTCAGAPMPPPEQSILIGIFSREWSAAHKNKSNESCIQCLDNRECASNAPNWAVPMKALRSARIHDIYRS